MTRTPLRAALRFALSGCLGLAAVAAPARAAEPEKVLPDSTLFLFKVKNVSEFRDGFKQSQFGQLLADPAIKPIKDDVLKKLESQSKALKEKLGVTLDELLKLPQGPAHVAVVTKSGGQIPIAVLVSADAGKNEKAMTDVMLKSTKQAEEADAKVKTEPFKGLTLHIIQPPKDGDKPNPPLVWTNSGSVFHLATDVEALKDAITHADGRSNSLAGVDSFTKSMAKLGDAPVSWFFDINKAIKLALQATQAKNPGAQNIQGILDQVGVNGLKSAAGTFTFNTGAFDSVSKVFFLAPAPAQGILKLFQMPPTNLKPEPWVPATVASYQTMSWELDGAYDALNDLVNTFAPGSLNMLEQQLVGPNGGEPLSLKKDIFGPLGDRLTLVSDFKKPATADSQRLLLGVALDDAKAFTNTLTKVLGMTGAAPAKREFQGTTIYDFKLPEMPQAPNGGPNNNPFKNGTATLAIAKDTLYLSNEPALLEATLRGGASALADSPEFQAVAKQMPAKVSSLTFSKAEESARVSYEAIKNGAFEQAFKGQPGAPDVGKVIDKDKIPDFSVFAKYLSNGGGFGLQEADGVTFTNFTLRKANP